jgi:nucleotide-binding universal stress UspA family protein
LQSYFAADVRDRGGPYFYSRAVRIVQGTDPDSVLERAFAADADLIVITAQIGLVVLSVGRLNRLSTIRLPAG